MPFPPQSIYFDADASSVGADLRILRKSRGLSASDIAEMLGCSLDYIHQMESGAVQPSVSELDRLAAYFNVNLGFFFGESATDPVDRGYVVRSHARRRLGTQDDGLMEELLSPDTGGSFEMIRTIIVAGARLKEPKFRRTEEAGYLISGSLTLTVGQRRFILNKGDSFRFSYDAYTWENNGDEDED